jgi:hypothetical protein
MGPEGKALNSRKTNMRNGAQFWFAVVILIAAAGAASAQQGTPAAQPAAVPPATPTAAEPTAAQGGARLSVNPAEFDFGEVWQGMAAKGEITVKNTGTEPLTINAQSSCGCTVATKPKSPLAPGESDTMTITYDTRRPGVAHKQVTLTTNDPTQLRFIVPVKGTVKPVFAVTPGDSIVFTDLEPDTHQAHTITLENKYDHPVHLKLKEGQNFDRFDVALKEIEPGSRYEITVSTNPPLRWGYNRASVVLETDLSTLPEIAYPVMGNVQPRVFASPPKLYVSPTSTQPSQLYVQVHFRKSSPLKILSVKPSLSSITCEVLPVLESPAPVPTAQYRIRVNLPKFEDIPETGAKLEITTDDPSPEFQKLEVQIARRPTLPMPGRVPAGLGKTVIGPDGKPRIKLGRPGAAQPAETPTTQPGGGK